MRVSASLDIRHVAMKMWAGVFVLKKLDAFSNS